MDIKKCRSLKSILPSSLPYLLILLFIMLFPGSLSYAAGDSQCAVVKIEINQELTLERQAFDAHMRINNGLSHITLADVDIDVSFSDEAGNTVQASFDPDDTDAIFFLRVDSTDNIDNINGNGTVDPSTSADIHWLIIPAPGASNGVPQGTLYYVGATLTYTIGGEEHITEVTPDYIFVKPMPELVLDYYLPSEVFGDDAFTTEIEPPVPFSLGVRVVNNGFGTAREMKINSAQPKITENEQGLLIGFVIEDCEVNGVPSEKSLLAEFGDIEPNSASIAMWSMSCTLSGQFVEFTADYSHSDELGGELTSLIEDINTHFLVRNVLVDISGRDSIKDFLAKDGGVYRVYESENIDTEVNDYSSTSDIIPDGDDYTLTTTSGIEFMYVKLIDPRNGNDNLKEVVRSDGKLIKPENAWLSKERDGQDWAYFINLFDINSTGAYSVTYEEEEIENTPPVLQFIPDRTVLEGEQISFIVEASDPDGTIPSLGVDPVPALAVFTDNGNGSATFDWTPASGQAGQYELIFSASDGELEDSQRVTITVNSNYDTDGDGLPDDWEIANFGNLDRDGTGDYDGDGISDLDEFLNNTDPTQGNLAPATPVIQSPMAGSEVVSLQPELKIQNSVDPDGDPITYTFEVYADLHFTSLILSEFGIIEGDGSTSWIIPSELTENSTYYWRVRATDGIAFSLWAYGSFFVNTENDPPEAFRISRPLEGIDVDTLTPVLEVSNGVDPDGDQLTYSFFIYDDVDMSNLITSVEGMPESTGDITEWEVETGLEDSMLYFWNVVATDEHGLSTESALSSFVINTLNNAPLTALILSPSEGVEISSTEIELIAGNATDPDLDPLTYVFELDTTATFNSPAMISSGYIPEGVDTTAWNVSDLDDNTHYYWRVKANDGFAESEWAEGEFFTNTANNSPTTPTFRNPGSGAWVDTLTPELILNPSRDVDNDALNYRFQLYADSALDTLIDQTETDAVNWTVTLLSDATRYWWRAQAVDEHDNASAWTEPSDFFVKDDGDNDPPSIIILIPDEITLSNQDFIALEWQDSDPDSNADISLYYDTDGMGEDGVLITDSLKEDPDGSGDTYVWDTSSVADGTYYIYAVITDELDSQTSYSTGAVILDKTPPTITMTPEAGVYSTPQTVSLSVDEPADIYYTLDGTDPETSGQIYEAPLEIMENITIKAVAVDMAGNLSEIITSVYTIQEDITVSVQTGQGRRLGSVKAYAFTSTGSYTGKSSTTDADGIAVFNPDDFESGNYKFRIDYLGSQFWSEVVSIPDTLMIEVLIPEELVEVTVGTGTGPAENVRVYLFSQSGSYLGSYQTTDENGNVVFYLPAGKTFKFRADILGNQYWSEDATIIAGDTNIVPVSAGGGLLNVTLEKGAGIPLEGIKTYLFNTSGSYLNRTATADASGIVEYDVPAGNYRIRADLLGYQFWSTDSYVNQSMDIQFEIPHQDILVTAEGMYQGAGTPIDSVKVYLFSPSGSYLNRYQVTDLNGNVTFSLPETAYKVRVDYLGMQFWSDEFIWQDTVVDIPMADAEVSVTGSGLPMPDLKVYLFNPSGSYLNWYELTDVNGLVTFRLPAENYKFRADYQGSQFWSGTATLTADQVNDIDISVGGGAFNLTLLRNSIDPLVGASCYVFDESGNYLNMTDTTNSEGQVSFDLADGAYKFRIDHMGYQFWSDIVNVPDVLDLTEEITHQDIFVTVEGLFQGTGTPIENIKIYLFTPSGSYLNMNGTTDENGDVIFSLPERAYKVRADYMGMQFWSDEFTWIDPVIGIPMADATITVTGSGLPMEGLPVYLFTAEGSYLNLLKSTDVAGEANFRVPAEAYDFRSDYQGSQYWSGVVDLVPDESNPIEIAVGGGLFNFTVLKNETEPLTGVKCYVFDENGSYLNMSDVTSSEGQVSFELAQGEYKFRVDYLGYQYWSDVYDVPSTLSDTFIIEHQDVSVNVAGMYQGISEPLEGIKVYLFSPAGSYQNRYVITDENGNAGFNLPAQSYKVRADYLGMQFWSDEFTWGSPVVEIPMADVMITTVGAGLPEEGLTVYLISSSGSYLNVNDSTDMNGQVVFRLPAETYNFRLDYQGKQFWSGEQSLVPDQTNSIQIDAGGGAFYFSVMKTAVDPLGGVKCYVYSDTGSYLNMSGITDSSGLIIFNLTAGAYKIRVDYLGYQFWTGVYDVPATLLESILLEHYDTMITVGGIYQGFFEPIEGIKVYLFNAVGSYQNEYRTTDENGDAVFGLPDAEYMARADYLNRQFWSDPFQFQDTSIEFQQGIARIHTHRSGADIEGAKIYLYSESGSYLNWYETSDVNGLVEFLIPAGNYKFGADEGGDQIWSGVIEIIEDVENIIEIDLDGP